MVTGAGNPARSGYYDRIGPDSPPPGVPQQLAAQEPALPLTGNHDDVALPWS